MKKICCCMLNAACCCRVSDAFSASYNAKYQDHSTKWQLARFKAASK